jgi:uncharacterized protein YecT (DUF1311 family)
MRQILTLLTFFICLTGFSQTQTEINQNADEAYKKADKELNSIYQKILTDRKSDTVFIQNFKSSQRIWIKFRDAELKVKYPEREPGNYGSMLPMCISIFLEKLTEERIATLKTYLEISKEENFCN